MSHHSSYDPVNEPQDAKLHETMKRLLGEFPNGKLNERDEGAIAMMVGLEDKKVIIKFPKPVAWIGMTAEEAIVLAQYLIKRARQAGHTRPLTIEL